MSRENLMKALRRGQYLRLALGAKPELTRLDVSLEVPDAVAKEVFDRLKPYAPTPDWGSADEVLR